MRRLASADWTCASALCSALTRILVDRPRRVTVRDEDAVALLLRRRLRDRRLRRGEVGFRRCHLVLVVDGAELGEPLALLHDGADVDLARGEAAADLESDLAHIARLNAAGALSHEGVVMRRDDDDTRRPQDCGRGCFFFGTARETEAGDAGA